MYCITGIDRSFYTYTLTLGLWHNYTMVYFFWQAIFLLSLLHNMADIQMILWCNLNYYQYRPVVRIIITLSGNFVTFLLIFIIKFAPYFCVVLC